MENIIEIITQIVGAVVNFPLRMVNRIPFISVMLYSYAISVLVVLGVAYLFLLYADSAKSFKGENANGVVGYSSLYKSKGVAKMVIAVCKILSIYMMLFTAYMFLLPVSTMGIDVVMENILIVIILFVAVFVMLIAQTRLYYIFDGNFSIKNAFLVCGAAVLVLRFFGIDDISFMGVIATVGCSYFVATHKRKFINKCHNTNEYFTKKNNQETYVEAPADKFLLEEIRANLVALGECDKDNFDDLAIVSETMATKVGQKEMPVLRCNNDEYIAYMNNLYETRCQNSEIPYFELNGNLKYYTSSIMIKAANNYSAEEYKPEAIEKVFNALGFTGEPTKENYIKFRKTAELLVPIYDAYYQSAKINWNYSFDNAYKIISSGVKGEDITEKTVQVMKKRYPDMQILKNFRFEYEENSTAECDLLILTAGGIFCIEVKNYGQDADYSIEILDNGNWYKKYGATMHEISGDPFRQNHMHAEALVKRFGGELSKLTEDGSIPVIHELVVIPNDITVINYSSNPVLHLSGLCEYIVTEMKKYDMDKINALAKVLGEEGMPLLRTENIDYAAWLENIKKLDAISGAYREIAKGVKLSEKYRKI